MNKKILLLCTCTQIAAIIYCQSGQMTNSRPDYKINLSVVDDLIYEATILRGAYLQDDRQKKYYDTWTTCSSQSKFMSDMARYFDITI